MLTKKGENFAVLTSVLLAFSKCSGNELSISRNSTHFRFVTKELKVDPIHFAQSLQSILIQGVDEICRHRRRPSSVPPRARLVELAGLDLADGANLVQDVPLVAAESLEEDHGGEVNLAHVAEAEYGLPVHIERAGI